MSYKISTSLKSLDEFEREQADFAAIIAPFLAPGINPLDSEDDIKWLDDNTTIAETIQVIKGDDQDKGNFYKTLHSAIEMHKHVYGCDLSKEQLAAVGGIVTHFADRWDHMKDHKNEKDMIVAESLEYAATGSENFSIIPQFLTIAALIPFTAVAYQLCHSVGSKAVDQMTVFELDEQVGKNPYSMTEGESINGLYSGELSNTNRQTDSAETADDVVTVFTAALDFPIVPSKVHLYVNKRPIAKDNGSGVFNLSGDGEISAGVFVVISASSIVYKTGADGSETSTISVTFGSAIPAGLSVWFEHETDVENYPAFVSETKYISKSFELYASPNIIRTGVTFQSILKSLRNMKIHLKDIAFSRLLAIVAADIDREALRRINRLSTGTNDFDKALTNPGVPAQDQRAMVQEVMGLCSKSMAQRTNGKAKIQNWLVDDNWEQFYRNLGPKHFKLSPAADNPALANQPHFLGEFNGSRIFYNPDNAANVASGIGKGTQISQCATVLGTVTPPMPHVHGTTYDLAKRCTLFSESFNDAPPEAWKYVHGMSLSDST